MNKAEMEGHHAAYHEIIARVRIAQSEGMCREAVLLALSSLGHVDGMMQYEQRYEKKEFASIESIDVILRYAPVLFDFQSLDGLASVLKEKRRIDRDASDDLGGRLSEARTLMWDARRMWNHLEEHAEVRQDELRQHLGGNQDRWRWVAETWEKMGLLRRVPEGGSYRVALSTRMGEVVGGKCPSCGAVAEAPKGMFLEKLMCGTCGGNGQFVILGRADGQCAKE
jgi:hypothetical protein